MDAQQNSIILPAGQMLDYEALLHEARIEPNAILHLRNHLPFKWRDLYVAAIFRPTNIVRFSCGTFEYIFDLYSELETVGEVPYDQTVEDRLVAVHGISARPEQPRDGIRMRAWLGQTGELLGATRDKGHFIAHCIGGGLDVNVFSQDRKLNPRVVTSGENLSSNGEVLPRPSRHILLLAPNLTATPPVFLNGWNLDCSHMTRRSGWRCSTT